MEEGSEGGREQGKEKMTKGRDGTRDRGKKEGNFDKNNEIVHF